MNKVTLRSFAIEARKELRGKVKMKAMELGITEENIKKETVQSSDAVFIEGKQLTIEEQFQRNRLIEEIRKKGYNQVLEEVAYTWFNRFTALRFMEINKYLSTKVRVLSSENEGSYEPDIIREALNISLDVDKELVYKLKTSKDNNATDKLYKYLISLQCEKLSITLPFLFEKINDYTKLLFPDGLLQSNFLKELTNLNTIPEENWQEVEIIGWLYQYYIAEENQRVIQTKKRYKKEEIPFATQLFTPDWIVRYMVQNSLGRYWVESHPEDRELIDQWEYYLENPNPELDFEEKLAPYLNKKMKIEEIKCFDPAMGSGHILVYIFDVLYQIYKRCGYMERDIPKLIIEKNLYGLEIDDRAYQLACFAIIMKAQQYNPRFLRDLESQVRNTGEYIKLNLVSIQETNGFDIKDIEYLAGETNGDNFHKTKKFIEQFREAKIYGSLTEIVEFDEEFLNKRVNDILNNPVVDLEYQESKDKVDNTILDLIKQTKIMNQIYDVLVTNPPYIGYRYLNPLLNDFISKKYSDVKADIFSAFMMYSFSKVIDSGQIGLMTPNVWMFISSYEKLREIIINEKNISSLIQLSTSGFSEAVVHIATFTLRNINIDTSGEYIRLTGFKGIESQPIKTIEAVINPNVEYRYNSKTEKFKKIPGSTIAYWVSESLGDVFYNNKTIGDIYDVKQGMTTADNNRFLRYWYEVNNNKIGYGCKDTVDAAESRKKWFPYNKGGAFRKWFGNNEYIVNYENDGYEMKEFTSKLPQGTWVRLKSRDYYFKESITWTFISSSKFGVRYSEKGYIFDVAGSSMFPEDDIYYILGFLSTNLTFDFLQIINPTLNYQIKDVKSLPIIIDDKYKHRVEKLVKDNILICKMDWNSFETSWDFRKHPLVNAQCTVHNSQSKDNRTMEEAFKNWKEFTERQFNRLKANEEEINRIFIEIYGLQDELNPEVEGKDITITKVVEEKSEEDRKNPYTIDKKQAVESFISYGIGCIFGRYSLDEEGLIYAGGEVKEKFRMDNIIPITDPQYFSEDVVTKFVDFIKAVFGENTLNENLKYIAESLGAKVNELPIETIRRYFLNDFYKNHIQIYKKRPIYWLFTSGKEKAFNALIYIHRYDGTTLAKMRTDYLHILQSKLDAESKSLIERLKDIDIIPKERRQYEKKLKDLEKKIGELKSYDEVLHHMADRMVEMDLDEGVRINYEIFEGLVQKI